MDLDYGRALDALGFRHEVPDRDKPALLDASRGPTTVLLIRDHGLSSATAVSIGYSREVPWIVHDVGDSVAFHHGRRWMAMPGDRPWYVARERSQVLAALADLLPPGGPYDQPDGGTEHPGLAEHLGRTLADLRVDVADDAIASDLDLDRLDRDLLRFLHRLLFIRAHEDRTQTDWPRLSDIATSETPVGLAVDLMARYETTFDSRLFEDPYLAPGALGGSRLKRLATALTEPWEELHLDFSVVRNDLAGRLYENYLRYSPVADDSGRLFGVTKPSDLRRSRAAHYTPSALASFLAAETLAGLDGPVTVLDPTCGSGAFLLAAYEYLESALGRQLRREPDQQERIGILSRLYGCDTDSRAIELTRLQLLEAARIDDGPLPDLSHNLLVHDALTLHQQRPPGWPTVFDAVLANPPFHGVEGLTDHLGPGRLRQLREQLGGFATADLAFFFLGVALSCLAPHGRSGWVLPRVLFSGAKSAKPRDALLNSRAVERIVDLRSTKVFDATAVRITLLVTGQGGPTRLDTITDTSTSIEEILQDLSTGTTGRSVDSYELADGLTAHVQDHGNGPVTPFNVRIRTDGYDGIGARTVPLAVTGHRVLVGPLTGARKRFVLPADRCTVEGRKVVVDGIAVDARFLPLLVRGRAIRPFWTPAPDERLFIPADDHGLTSDAAALALLDHLGGLANTHRYGPATTAQQPKVLLRRLYDEPAATVVPTHGWIAENGSGGAFSLIPDQASPEDLDAICGLLMSSVYQYLLGMAGQAREGRHVELNKTDLDRLPWPRLSPEDWQTLSGLGKAARHSLTEEQGRARHFRRARQAVDDATFDLLRISPQLSEAATTSVRRHP